MISLVTIKSEKVFIYVSPNKETTKIKEVCLCDYKGCELLELEMTKVIFQKKNNEDEE